MELLADTLPKAVYSVAQVAKLERIAIERFAIPGFELMTRAAQAALDVLRRRWPSARTLAVFCGAGNNAGDGYVLARLAVIDGLDVRVVAVGDPTRLHGDAAEAYSQCAEAGIEIVTWPGLPTQFAPDVVIDAILGTGLTRALDPAFAAAVAHINEGAAPVFALDVPSGLDANTGLPRGAAVRAELTITFLGLKQGLYLGRAPDYRGQIAFADLGVPREAVDELAPTMERLSPELLARALPPRRRGSHKGTNGRVLLIGGGPGMGGAIRLASEAALRAGAGLVYVATHPDNVVTVLAGRPEIICRGVEAPGDLDALIELADVLVIGPGLGQTPWAEGLWRRAIGAAQPCVVDADGLNLLARFPYARKDWILTPHAGEAARLLGVTNEDIGLDRLGSAGALAQRFHATSVLKGACSLVVQVNDSDSFSVSICDRGNPGMATAGTGDVLAGVIGALLAQLADVGLAARVGVLLHAMAGDDAAVEGERGMVAGDLLAHIRRRANPR
jgi:NAD(P)H-hydrate epimerase